METTSHWARHVVNITDAQQWPFQMEVIPTSQLDFYLNIQYGIPAFELSFQRAILNGLVPKYYSYGCMLYNSVSQLQKQITSAMHKYQVLEQIGQGVFGLVHKCKAKQTGQIVAIKKFKENNGQEDQNNILREVRILKKLSHPNIIAMKEAYKKGRNVYLVFQFVEMNLLEYLQMSSNGLNGQSVKLIVYQILKGLAYLHSLEIIHRDIKPENLLINEKKQLQICDFGFAKVYDKHNVAELTDYVATRWYRPPQLLLGECYDKGIDIWAVGCIMGELIDGEPVFPGENELHQLSLIENCFSGLTYEQYQSLQRKQKYKNQQTYSTGQCLSLKERYRNKVCQNGINLLTKLLEINPDERVSAKEALKHPYFDSINKSINSRKFSKKSMNRDEKSCSTTTESKPKIIKMKVEKYITQKPKKQCKEMNLFYNPEGLLRKSKRSVEVRLKNKEKNEEQKKSQSVYKIKLPIFKENTSREKNIFRLSQNRGKGSQTNIDFYPIRERAIKRSQQYQKGQFPSSYKNKKNKYSNSNPNNITDISKPSDQAWELSAQLPNVMSQKQKYKKNTTRARHMYSLTQTQTMRNSTQGLN